MVKTKVVRTVSQRILAKTGHQPFDLEPTFLMDASLSMTTALFCKFGFLLNEAPWIILRAVVYAEAKGDQKKSCKKSLQTLKNSLEERMGQGEEKKR